MRSPGRLPGLLANLALSLASLVVFVALAEGTARLVDLRPRSGGALANPAWLGERWLVPRKDYRERLADAGFLSRYYELFQWDRFLFYRLRPERRLDMIDPLAPGAAEGRANWTVETNAEGFRGAEFAPSPAAGRHRIVSLGDSSTFGWGVPADEAYPARLREALAREIGWPEERVEVLNLGVPGYSSFQGQVLLQRTGLALHPEAVTWGFGANDGAFTGESDRLAYERRRGWSGALLAALHTSRAFEAFEAWFDVAAARLARTSVEPKSERNVASYAETARNAAEAVAAARAAGVPLVLVAQCMRGPAAATLAEVARETGTPFLDATALLDEAVPGLANGAAYAELRARAAARYGESTLAASPYLLAFLPDGCHPNAWGHEAIAEALARKLAPVLRRDAASAR